MVLLYMVRNIYHQYNPNVSIYIYHTWILWIIVYLLVWSSIVSYFFLAENVHNFLFSSLYCSKIHVLTEIFNRSNFSKYKMPY